MTIFYWTALLTAAGLAVWIVQSLRRARRRVRLLRTPLSPARVVIIERNITLYHRMPPALQTELQGLVQVFLDEKNMEGCGGLELTDEIRITIAAEACLLLLGRGVAVYPHLRTVLVYPDAYVAADHGPFHGDAELLGESWSSGTVVLAWNHVQAGGINFDDGHNVALHEFAHQLDQEDGLANGTPLLTGRTAYTAWASVLGREYEALRAKTSHGRRDVLDDYGATDPAEFFAVATETFFEKPRTLKRKHPELYEELRTFYRVDPGEWEEREEE